jgi:N-methylhydantoinase A/oxoprolinase/acetone carboxylase beta subunit
LGGPAATLTDALRGLGKTQIGDLEAAQRALGDLGQALGIDAEQVAHQALTHAVQKIEAGIEDMFRLWQMEHVYRIWELKQKKDTRPRLLLGLGAAGHAVIPALARHMDMDYVIPQHAEVANALGAALARTTYSTTLHLDTEQQFLSIIEEGIQEPWTQRRISLQEVRGIARDHMVRRGKALGLSDPLLDVEEVLAEQFNVVEGWNTVGRIFDVKLERPCGLVEGGYEAGGCSATKAQRHKGGI